MLEPAQESRTGDHPLSINGLEDVFIAEDSPAQDFAPTQDSTPQDIRLPQDSPAQDMTVSEAAKVIGISEKTVLRRLQRGSLSGYKVTGQFGPEWRVKRAAEDSPAQAQDRTPQDIRLPQDSPAQDIIIYELRDEIAALRKQLEGAIYRNGYLEAKLEEREGTIKLLTDSHHRSGWWARFCCWFSRGKQSGDRSR